MPRWRALADQTCGQWAGKAEEEAREEWWGRWRRKIRAEGIHAGDMSAVRAEVLKVTSRACQRDTCGRESEMKIPLTTLSPRPHLVYLLPGFSVRPLYLFLERLMFAALSSRPKRTMIWCSTRGEGRASPSCPLLRGEGGVGPPLTLLALLAARSDLAAALRFSLTISHAHLGHFGAVWGPAPPVAARSPAATRQSCLCLEDHTREFWKREETYNGVPPVAVSCIPEPSACRWTSLSHTPTGCHPQEESISRLLTDDDWSDRKLHEVRKCVSVT